jgi:hypothetical protein
VTQINIGEALYTLLTTANDQDHPSEICVQHVFKAYSEMNDLNEFTDFQMLRAFVILSAALFARISVLGVKNDGNGFDDEQARELAVAIGRSIDTNYKRFKISPYEAMQ